MRKHVRHVFTKSWLSTVFAAYFLVALTTRLIADRRYSRRRHIAGYAVPLSDHRRLMRFGLRGRQIYLIGASKNRNSKVAMYRWVVVIAGAYCILSLASPALSDIGIIRHVSPQEAMYAASFAASASVLSALAALVFRSAENARRNRGRALAALAIDTVEELANFYRYNPRGSGLSQGGAKYSMKLGKWRRTVRENCWRITLWSADITGRPRSDYSHESVSSFPRILLWAMDQPDLERMRVAYRSLVQFIEKIDNNHLDLTLPEASDTKRQIPEMKKPSILVRVRRAMSITKISATITVFAGTATILTFFKVPATLFLP